MTLVSLIRSPKIAVAAAVVTAGLAVMAAPADAATTDCTGTLVGVRLDSVNVPAGAACTLIDARVGGNVHVENTTQLFVFGSTVGGNVDARRATDAVQVCDTRGGGNLKVQQSGRDVLVGDPLTVDCAGNRVGGNIAIEDNVTDVELIVRGNVAGGNVRVFDNEGPSVKAVQDNSGGGTLECTRNAAPFVGSPNGSFAIRRG